MIIDKSCVVVGLLFVALTSCAANYTVTIGTPQYSSGSTGYPFERVELSVPTSKTISIGDKPFWLKDIAISKQFIGGWRYMANFEYAQNTTGVARSFKATINEEGDTLEIIQKPMCAVALTGVEFVRGTERRAVEIDGKDTIATITTDKRTADLVVALSNAHEIAVHFIEGDERETIYHPSRAQISFDQPMLRPFVSTFEGSSVIGNFVSDDKTRSVECNVHVYSSDHVYTLTYNEISRLYINIGENQLPTSRTGSLRIKISCGEGQSYKLLGEYKICVVQSGSSGLSPLDLEEIRMDGPTTLTVGETGEYQLTMGSQPCTSWYLCKLTVADPDGVVKTNTAYQYYAPAPGRYELTPTKPGVYKWEIRSDLVYFSWNDYTYAVKMSKTINVLMPMSAERDTEGVTVRWSAIEGTDTAYVYRSDTAEKTNAVLIATVTDGSVYSDRDIVAGRTYWYWIKLVGAKKTIWSVPVASSRAKGETYEVLFDLGVRGTRSGGGVLEQTIEQGASAIAPDVLANKGYSFVGWDKPFVAVTNDLVVTALYRPISYRIHFDANAGSGLMADISLSYDSQTNLQANAFTREHYHFVGWAKSSDGGVVFADCSEIENLSCVQGEEVVLYAQWAIDIHMVTFDLGTKGCRTGGGELTQKISYGSSAVEPCVTAVDGYSFSGWNQSFSTVMGDIVVIAQYSPIAYAIRFDSNGGMGSMDGMVLSYDCSTNLAANSFSRDGYLFDGWATAPKGEVVYRDVSAVLNLTAVEGDEIVLYAKWVEAMPPNSCAVKWIVEKDVYGYAATTKSFSSTQEINNAIGELPKASFRDWFFDGWWTEQKGGERITPSFVVTNGMECYAHFIPVLYCTTNGSIMITGPGAVAVDIDIPEMMDGTNVTSIAAEAFVDGRFLSVSIPDSVTNIGCGSFMRCKNLTKVELPSTLKEIENYVFEGCESMSNIILPSQLRRIGYGAFMSSGLTEILLPSSVTNIDNLALADCDQLGAIIFGSGVKELPREVFINCHNLTNVSFVGDAPTGVVYLNNQRLSQIQARCGTRGWARHWNGLEVIFDDPATVILSFEDDVPSMAYKQGDLLSLPMEASRVGYDFIGWLNPDSESELIDNTSGLSGDRTLKARWAWHIEWDYELVDGGVRLLSGGQDEHCFTKASVVIPSTVVGLPVICLGSGKRLFNRASYVSDLVIPSSIATIADWAFMSVGVKSLVLPRSIKHIGAYAFYNSTVTNITSRAEDFTIGDSAFNGCAELYEIDLTGCSSVGYSAFGSCKKLHSVRLSNSLVSIENFAFSYCDKLISLTIPETVTNLGWYVFSNSTNLLSLTFNGDVPDATSKWFLDSNSPLNENFTIYAYNDAMGWPEGDSWLGRKLTILSRAGVTLPSSATSGKEVTISREWLSKSLDANYGEGTSIKFREKYGRDFVSALQKPTGKVDGSGQAMYVWQDYVAGTDPTAQESMFTAEIEIVDGLPKVSWKPDLNEDGAKNIRLYTTMGCERIGGEWRDMSMVNEADKAKYQFFKVTVDMP